MIKNYIVLKLFFQKIYFITIILDKIMNGTGQKITVFNNLTDDNNFIISIDDVDDVDFNHRNESKKIKHTSSSSKFKRLSQLFKSNSVNSCSVSMSSSSYSSDDGLDMKIIPFFNENSECIICLDKYNDFKLELNPNKLDKFNSNQIYQIKSCKCKFCINVSLFFFCYYY
jgi:hypothetical protein